MDGTESGNIWQNSRKLCTVLNVSPLLIPSVMHFSWNKQISEVVCPGKTHFTFYWFICSTGIVLEKITCEGDIFIRIATSFLFEHIYWWSGVWIHNTIDRSNGKCGGCPKKKGSAAKSKCWISCHFYSPQPELLRKVWLIEGRGGGDSSSPRGSPSYNSCTLATIWPHFYAREDMAFASLFTIFILCLSWLIQDSSHHSIREN